MKWAVEGEEECCKLNDFERPFYTWFFRFMARARDSGRPELNERVGTGCGRESGQASVIECMV